jgi:hypothetical protein
MKRILVALVSTLGDIWTGVDAGERRTDHEIT